MKTLIAVLLFVLAFSQFAAARAQVATARMFCFSPKISQGTGIWDSTLDLTTVASSVNGELAPASSGTYSYETYIFMYNELWYDEPIGGSMAMDLPEFVDTNGDGFDDFFDTSCAIFGSSQGTYNFPGWGSSSVSVIWSRAAGSKSGTCTINLQGFGDFSHTFDILEYRGTISYVPAVTSVSGVLAVSKTGDAAQTFGGQLHFTKDVANPANWLTLLGGSLTNASGQSWLYYEWDFDRVETWPTNYYGYIEFQDGNLGTPEEDYYWWLLSIDDLNDSDGDGVPDFSDTPSAVVRRAVLSLAKGVGGLTLTISADTGTTWRIQKSSSLTGDWSEATTVAITTDPQIVPLAEPTVPTFWRAIKL